jgi:hypothetical protein
MRYVISSDGRVLTPTRELKPLLKEAFPAFFKLVGHIRLFYMSDENWDGKSFLSFKINGGKFITIKLDEINFSINFSNKNYNIVDEKLLNVIFDELKITFPIEQHRPIEQLLINPNEYSCGYRCDLCLMNKRNNQNGYEGNKIFHEMDWNCYHPEYGEERANYSNIVCEGCTLERKNGCKNYTCPIEKGFTNCMECGEYYTCDICKDCHTPGECNLGITADEVTKIVVPYARKERFDLSRNMDAIKK